MRRESGSTIHEVHLNTRKLKRNKIKRARGRREKGVRRRAEEPSIPSVRVKTVRDRKRKGDSRENRTEGFKAARTRLFPSKFGG